MAATPQGAVLSTFVRKDKHSVPEIVDSIDVKAGLGIKGDCHASAHSPRQVLFAAKGSYDRLSLEQNCLRENVLIDVAVLDWPSGAEVRVGARAKFRIMFPCDPCSRLNSHRAGLSKDAAGDRGVLARVETTGTIRPGDSVRMVPGVYATLSADWRHRLLDVLYDLEPSSYVTYSDLAVLTGVHKSFCRAFPSVIRRHTDACFENGGVITPRRLAGSLKRVRAQLFTARA